MDTLTDRVIDTIALVRHLEDDLPAAADRIFREAEAGRVRLFLPEIALGEFLYIGLRGRIRAASGRAALEEIVEQITSSAYISVSALGPGGWRRLLDLEIPELHDRMIAADALDRGLSLVSNDPAFASVSGLRVEWR